MSTTGEQFDLPLPERVDLWRDQIGARKGLIGTGARAGVDFDAAMLVRSTSTMIRLVGSDRCSPNELQPVATALAAVRDRQLQELGPGVAVNAVVVCDTASVSRESYRVCESVGVELVCFNDTYDRPRLAQIVTAQSEDLPSTHPAVHKNHQSDQERKAELDAALGDDEGALDSLAAWEFDSDPDLFEPDTGLELAPVADELEHEGGVPRSWAWNDEHPYDLRLFWSEEPDFDMPPVSLEGLSGAALRERKVQLARAYMGFDPESEGIQCPLMLKGYERVFFVLGGSGLVEYRKPPRLPARRGPSVRVGTVSRVTRGTYLSMSTRVGSTAVDAAPAEEVLTPVDDGYIVVTSDRVAFVGERMQREWRHRQAIGSRVETLRVDGFPPAKAVMIPTSNRVRVSGFYLNDGLVSTLQFMIELARCQSAEDRQKLVRSLSSGGAGRA